MGVSFPVPAQEVNPAHSAPLPSVFNFVARFSSQERGDSTPVSENHQRKNLRQQVSPASSSRAKKRTRSSGPPAPLYASNVGCSSSPPLRTG